MFFLSEGLSFRNFLTATFAAHGVALTRQPRGKLSL